MFSGKGVRGVYSLGMCLLAGCTLPSAPEAMLPAEISPNETPVIRQNRYTLIELQPADDQMDLQQQIIDLRIPATAATRVGDAMRYVLRHSGYQLCEGDPALASLWALPLPAAHWRLGPLPLNQTLQLLAGNTWRLVVDDGERQVCFTRTVEVLP
ncbi:type IV pili sensor histidine kinase and response regulator [Pseudomonas cedrina]|uniref:Pilus assembly protein PilL n=3 Tax=Pseudomonas cedrina TaxID=651740 RepID=A0A1V2JZV4_PSECE|nr:hypothetical protein BLL36_23655 [Pseudomonas cedrina subsp. cedrina]SDS63151.1 type IV pili sensor histidine kinase and response regulator [Pseudomonas cedrina]